MKWNLIRRVSLPKVLLGGFLVAIPATVVLVEAGQKPVESNQVSKANTQRDTGLDSSDSNFSAFTKDVTTTSTGITQRQPNRQIAGHRIYLQLKSSSIGEVVRALDSIQRGWHPGGAAMLVDICRFSKSRLAVDEIIKVLQSKTGQRHGRNLNGWYKWIWSQKYNPHPEYAQFKSAIYSPIDKRFAEYFITTKDSKIRLDEIRWGGVRRDGIPPLKNPKMIPAANADYLADSNIVFGVSLNGDNRCYPKRILAWHEMFKDTIGGEPVCGAY